MFSAVPKGSGSAWGAPSSAVKVLFVGGMPRSGSTLFDLMVGQLPGYCDVGELFYLWQAGPLRNQLCACGLHFDRCPFWTDVGDDAFGGWQTLDVAEVLSLQRRVDTTLRLALARLDGLLPAHADDVRRYLDLTRALYEAIARRADASVVVDSTKRPSTAYLLAADPGVELAVAHVVRDPRAVVNSWNEAVKLPDKAASHAYMPRRAQRQTMRRWLTVNLMMERLRATGVPTKRIRYEDLVSDPQTAMRQVMALWGTSPVVGDLDFITPDGLRTGTSHAVAGGRVRLSSGPLPLRLDDRWRRELSPWRSRLTVAVTWPLMRHYGYR